jgi:C-5 cytosine-specific DNA methylase
MRPLAIDLFCGLGGWTDGLLAEGYDVIGFDIKQHVYGEDRYPAQLVVQDVCTLHGSQFKDATLIVASPPCQEYSYMAMPWKLAKAKAAAIRADTTGEKLAALNLLFNQCFRIQKEASLAAGKHIPMLVENVRGAIPWVGRSRWNFGSFHLWGDVPALMPITLKAAKVPGFRFDGSGKTFQSASVAGLKGAGPKWDPATKSGAHGMKRWTNPAEGVKCGGDWFNAERPSISRMTSSGSPARARARASAMIAKIPLPLSRHIAATYSGLKWDTGVMYIIPQK